MYEINKSLVSDFFINESHLLVVFLKINLFYLFIFGCVGSLLRAAFL